METVIAAFIIGAIAGWILHSFFAGGESFINIEEKLITNAEAATMMDNFNYGETQSVYFSIEEVLGFINFVTEKNQTSDKATGLEIFFGAYNKDQDITMFIYPTKDDNQGIPMPFDCNTGEILTFPYMRNTELNGHGPNLAALNKSNMRPPNPIQ